MSVYLSVCISQKPRGLTSPIFVRVDNGIRGLVFTKLYSPKMVETQNATMLNKEIKYNSSPTLTILFTKRSTPLYRANCPTCNIYTETYKCFSVVSVLYISVISVSATDIISE